jgi:hypothetical protein
MKWAYDLTGAEPIIKDMPAYDGTAIQNGELLMIGTSAFSAGADAGIALVSAAPDTVAANAAINAVGISLEQATTAGTVGSTSSIASAHNVTTAVKAYVKTIINPFAVYRAETLTSSASAVAATPASAQVTVTGVAAHSANGYWLYFQGTGGGARGNLRMVVTSATAGTMVLDAATVTGNTADTVLFITQKGRAVTNVSGGSSTAVDCVYAISQTVMTGATNLRVVEVYIDRNQGLEVLRYQTHRQTNGLPTNTKFHYDLMMKDHLWGADL